MDLHGRDFLKEIDFKPAELTELLNLASELKSERRAGREIKRMQDKNIALVFEKDSTRTRCAFEVAAHEQGAHVTWLGSAGSQIGHKESIADTARVLSRFFDGIEYRGFEQSRVEALAEYSSVPVWNGLTNEWHPTQLLADLLTMRENCARPLAQQAFAYLGDARYNMGNSLMIGAAMMGMDFRSVAPRELWTKDGVHELALGIADVTGAKIIRTEDIDEGVRGCDFLYTDVWVSMGEPEEVWEERIRQLLPYRVTRDVLSKTGNASCGFLHCLPAFHDLNTSVGRKIHERFGLECMEVSDDVFESPASLVFDQAENRLHTIKAVMVATIGRDT